MRAAPSSAARRRLTARRDGTVELNLTSMMDLFTIILVFLLHSFSSAGISSGADADVLLPFAGAAEEPALALNVVVSRKRILVDGEEVVALRSEPDPSEPLGVRLSVAPDDLDGRRIVPLHTRLVERAEAARALSRSTGRDDLAFRGRVLLQCDRDLPYGLVRAVVETAGAAGYEDYQLVVYRSE